jgi:plasmid stabilization system protein ParE
VIEYGFRPEASIDPDDIWEFIAADDVDAANKVIEEIFDVVDILVAFPHQGYRRPNLTSRPLRFKLLREYVIAYRYCVSDSPARVSALASRGG